MTTAADRGWGTPDRLHGRIVKITPAGIALQVNELVAPLFEAALNDCWHRGYDFARVADDWGYAKRYIRGYEAQHIWSNHAWGLAIDVNAVDNPMTSDGRVHTNMPLWMIAVMANYGFFWGGNYSGKRKDAMHFEFLGTPAQAAIRVAALKVIQTPPSEPDPELLEDDMAVAGPVQRGTTGPLYAIAPSNLGRRSVAVMMGSMEQLYRLMDQGLVKRQNHVSLPEGEFDAAYGKPDHLK